MNRVEILDGKAARLKIRDGRVKGQTSGMAPGYVQGNIVILPLEWAEDFRQFCLRNPKPCPLIGVGYRGDPSLPGLGRDIDIRTDVPSYRLFKDGVEVETLNRIDHLWSGELVTFVLGCSFSFESQLIKAGLGVRHIDAGTNVPMYRTSIDCTPAGRFTSKMVVSMRPFSGSDVARAVEVTTRFPQVHGAPVHIGDPAGIGIRDITRPDFGDEVEVKPGEVPVFWACGVTPQVALEMSRPPFAITHSPGCMLITDIHDEDLESGRFVMPH